MKILSCARNTTSRGTSRLSIKLQISLPRKSIQPNLPHNERPTKTWKVLLPAIEDLLQPPAFRKLIRKMSHAAVPEMKTFTQYLDKAYELKKSLENVGHISTTADIWSANSKSFLGMTVHWINLAILQCRRAAIVCVQFKGHDTYEAIAAEIDQIHVVYSVNAKAFNLHNYAFPIMTPPQRKTGMHLGMRLCLPMYKPGICPSSTSEMHNTPAQSH